MPFTNFHHGSKLHNSPSRVFARIKGEIDNGATEVQIADKYFCEWVEHYKAFRVYAKIKGYTNYQVEITKAVAEKDLIE